MPMKSTTIPSSARHRSPVRGAAGDPMLRIGGTIGLPATLQSLGANPAQLLAEVGLDLSPFDSPDNRPSFAAPTAWRSARTRRCPTCRASGGAR